MSLSKFTIYSSFDSGNPGFLSGTAGSLIAVLDACLVNGYTGKPAPSPAWTHPVPTAGNIASYKQGSGAGIGLVINDNGPNVTSTFKEAWATGWEVVTGVGSPVGSGFGQFPTPAQSLTSGHVVFRKSTTADAVARGWILFADSSTFYLFILTGDGASSYLGVGFGDVYSLKGATDTWRCFIMGNPSENSTASISVGLLTVSIGQTQPGHFMARTASGGGSSILFGKTGDTARGSNNGATSPTGLFGLCQAPNSVDNAYYISPVWANEGLLGIIRGRMRGFWHLCHPIANFVDGQSFQGSGELAGKTFQLVKPGTIQGEMWCIETSATVETN